MAATMLEKLFQRDLVEELEVMFIGCIIIRLDPRYVSFYVEGVKYSQGVMDILILFPDGRWAALEVKRASSSSKQPNQGYHVQTFDRLSYAAFICPDNKEEVLDDLQRTFGAHRQARLSRS